MKPLTCLGHSVGRKKGLLGLKLPRLSLRVEAVSRMAQSKQILYDGQEGTGFEQV